MCVCGGGKGLNKNDPVVLTKSLYRALAESRIGNPGPSYKFTDFPMGGTNLDEGVPKYHFNQFLIIIA